MSRMAQELQRQVDELRKGVTRPKGIERQSDNQLAKAGKETMMAKREKKKAHRTTKRQRAPKARQENGNGVSLNPLAGVRVNPKNKRLFINRAAALALVERLLRETVKNGDGTPEEQYEATRLIARIEARQ